jgi:hypothetical protein
MSEITTLQIQGAIVVLPLDEYLEMKAQLEEHRRLKTIYEQERESRFQRLFKIAERNPDIPLEQVTTDVAAAINSVRFE